MKNLHVKLGSILQIAFAYVGTVVGAGFASGQEIMRFFSIYGTLSYIAIIISTLLFILIGIKIMKIGMKYKATSFKEMFDCVFSPTIANICNIILTICLIITTIVMLAGAGAVFEEQLGIQFIYGIIITCICTFLIVIFGISGLFSINVVVVPILILFNIILFIFTCTNQNLLFTNSLTSIIPIINIFRSGVLYVLFNVMLSLGVLGAIGHNIDNTKTLIYGGILGGLILGILIIFENTCLLAYSPGILQYEIPIAHIAIKMGNSYHTLFTMVVWGEIVTTLVASVYSLVEYANQLKISRFTSIYVILLFSSIISHFGFSTMVHYLYPLLGIIGLFFIPALFIIPEIQKNHMKKTHMAEKNIL